MPGLEGSVYEVFFMAAEDVVQGISLNHDARALEQVLDVDFFPGPGFLAAAHPYEGVLEQWSLVERYQHTPASSSQPLVVFEDVL